MNRPLTSRRFVLPRLEKLATRARHAAVRLIGTIPEVNLVDWQSHQPSPVLPNGRESDWHDALANLDAPRLCALDDSATATSRRLAGSTEEPGPNQLARYRNEVGAACGPLRAVTTSPMASREIQQLLSEWVDDHGFASVDVPALIGSMGSGEPDRTWFLDYCHHTGDRGGGRSGRRCRRYYRTNRTDFTSGGTPPWAGALDRRPTGFDEPGFPASRVAYHRVRRATRGNRRP
ncbi:MAG: hypothetical protein HOK58_03035 [Acidimicrobiaceae bacterium]|nr:hypothetical protein [Acidimicrobiaceae bacterium]